MARISDNSSYQENQSFDLTAYTDVLARLQQIRQSLNASLSGLEGTSSDEETSSVSGFSSTSVSESAPASFSTSVSDFCDLDALDRFLSTCVTPGVSLTSSADTTPRASQTRTSRLPLPREISLCDVFADEPAESAPALDPTSGSTSGSSLHSTYSQTQYSQTQPAPASSSNPFARLLPAAESESATSPEPQRQASVPSAAKWGQDFQYFAAGGIACGAVLLGLGYYDSSSVMSVWQLGFSLLIAGGVSLLCSFACMASARPKRS